MVAHLPQPQRAVLYGAQLLKQRFVAVMEIVLVGKQAVGQRLEPAVQLLDGRAVVAVIEHPGALNGMQQQNIGLGAALREQLAQAGKIVVVDAVVPPPGLLEKQRGGVFALAGALERVQAQVLQL